MLIDPVNAPDLWFSWQFCPPIIKGVFFNLLDGVVVEEDLLDFGSTVLGEDQYGPYYEYLNASCAPATNYYDYANRVFSIAADDINTSQTIKACFGSCNDTCEGGSINYALIWNDEFDGNGAIDSSNWFHQTQLPNGYSWYNNDWLLCRFHARSTFHSWANSKSRTC